MKRFLGSLSRRSSSSDSFEHREDSPEAIVLKELTAFCESNTNTNAHGPPGDAQGTEFVHLPKIVEAAESSPNAAKQAALRIRKYLADPAGTPNRTQYNAIMLMRILVDNPGHTFTRNFDAKFVTVIKELLRTGRDFHVQNYLRQYLGLLDQQRPWDEDLKLLLQMWAKEKMKAHHGLIDPFPMNTIIPPQVLPRNQQQPYSQPRAPANTLPNPVELVARIEEARNSAKLLTQFVQSTPPAELENNDLIKEFIDRCRTGSRCIQGYIHSTNPAPDEDTLLTLIETNDEISVALSQQQRAMLKARKIRGSSSPSSSNLNSPSPTSPSTAPAATNFSPPPGPPARTATQSSEFPAPVAAQLPSTAMPGGRAPASNPAPGSATTSRYEYNAEEFQVRNPFADDYATNDSAQERHRVHGDTQPHSDHVRFQPTEKER
ncbi:hypothetical protein N7472_009271 [Penicillium cf. griseofulvum]|uniref:GAT domain-containing protein n=1 Tax=Penicillium cf. griseofulvum TaxID=2972120 RepID=A0A9W9IVT5_9EURO|nr:hypothetical protein N7472_009271 [Penicillium cf. griseofulvum]KAJ5435543.1 hypothetical protein N7445_006428 [Penicillium cf. griseofulvum]